MRHRTITRAVSLRGSGLLTRRPVEATLRPALAGTGIVFNESVRASPGNASVESHSMCVGRGGNRVRTIEHLMAACAGFGVTDLSIKVTGGELPFLDGSSRPFVQAFRRAGLSDAGGKDEPTRVSPTIVVRPDGAFILVQPAPLFQVWCAAGPAGCPVSSVTVKRFEPDVAEARTFGPLDEPIETFRRRHRLRFGIVRRSGSVFPRRFRMPDEPVRHKVLDLIGDLWLLGRPLHACVLARNPGHRLNLALARELEAQCTSP